MSRVKIALCQFGLKDMRSYEEFENHIISQCDQAISQGPDIILFPELLTLSLLAMAGPDLSYDDVGRAMVEFVDPFTPRYEAVFSNLAKENNVVIAGGSHWTIDKNDGKGYNTAHLFYPDGHIGRQKKNHLFPGETDWGTVTFDGLTAFNTPKTRVGIMTCYDAEFPEVGRHYMLEGAEVLL
ncbi:MAG: hypothetical protein JRL30_09330 [Deltaproteobacteria bacterium]|nr:hypothetical protein [Deltaproteobacteria bacterium]